MRCSQKDCPFKSCIEVPAPFILAPQVSPTLTSDKFDSVWSKVPNCHTITIWNKGTNTKAGPIWFWLKSSYSRRMDSLVEKTSVLLLA
jgi:hypothetical protein